jgi:hypothetical protein
LVRVRGSALCEGGPPEQLELLVEGATATVVGRGLPSPRIARKHSGVQGADEARWEAVVDLRGTRMASVSMTLLTRMAGRGWGELAHASYGLEPEGPRAGTRSRAAFTIVQNEPVFLPLWLAHYRRYFDPDDIYVLDHDSTDGSTSGLTGTCNVLPVHRSASFDHDWLRSTAEQFQSFLLASYETVLYAEADEFIVAEPTRHSGLDSYIEELRGPAACCTGYEVVHYPSEQPLRLDSPILGQRQYWHSSARYSKRLIAKAPLAWGQGFHRELRFPEVRPDPDLYLIHLHRADYDRCHARHRSAASRNWSERDLAGGAGSQNRIVEADEFRHWFYNVGLGSAERERIPDRLKALL